MNSDSMFEIFNGKKIYTYNKNDYISKAISIYKCWEPNISFFIDKKFNNSGNFFDIGGNIGYYSLAFSDKFKNVYCFEPNPKNIKKIKKSIEANGIKNITIIEKPVAQVSNLKYVAYNRNNVSDSNIGGIQFVETSGPGIETISLDDFIFLNKIESIDLLKIDIEGGELECLLGSKNSINNGIIKNIIIEITPKFSLEDSREILFFLSKKYELYNLGLQELGKIGEVETSISKILDIDVFLTRVKVQTNLFCKIKE